MIVRELTVGRTGVWGVLMDRNLGDGTALYKE